MESNLRLMNNDCFVRKDSKPYDLALDSNEGRFLVANRDIKAGEVILQEMPSFLAPKLSTKPVCLGCHTYLDHVNVTCDTCGWPMCSTTCPDRQRHASECAIFARQGHRFQAQRLSLQGIEPLYDIITPLRVLHAKDTGSQSYHMFMELESHLSQWKEDQGWQESHQFIVDYLKKDLGLTSLDMDDILHIFGICYTNDFSVKIDGGCDELGQPKNCPYIRLCYALVSMCSHDCVPNTWRSILGPESGFKHELKARTMIRKGDKITISYEDVMLPTLSRQEHLLQGKKFLCQCKRCKDPTELGTSGSALICTQCKARVNPDQDKVWRCTCKFVMTRDEVASLFKAALEESQHLLNDVDKCNVDRLEAFLDKYQKTLDPHNMLMIRVKYSLCGLYGRAKGYEMQELTPKALSRKKELCEEVLEVLNKVDTGFSPRKGMVMYELHLPLIMLTQLRLQQGLLDQTEAKKQFQLGLVNLKLSVEHLKHEPEGTFEKKVYYGAKESIKPLEDFVKNAFH